MVGSLIALNNSFLLAFSVFNVYRVVYVHILTAHAHVFELHHAVWCLCLYMVGRARSKVCLPGD